MIRIMILRIILYVCLVYASRAHTQPKCLTGSITDAQSWVDEHGDLTTYIEVQSTIDVSTMSNAVPLLQQQMSMFRSQRCIRFLSLAKCRLIRVPVIFDMQDSTGRKLCSTVEYMTLYGNEFADLSSSLDSQHDMRMNATNARELTHVFGHTRQSSEPWSSGFQEVTFPRLLELDLRRCSIQILNSADFRGMPQLEALYLGENSIFHVNANAFVGLSKLVHLDLSRNGYEDNGVFKTLIFGSRNIFSRLQELRSLDLSFTKLSQNNIEALRSIGKKLNRLSLCETGVRLTHAIFNRTSIRYLDLTGNYRILSSDNPLAGIEKTLEVLYADRIGLNSFHVFQNFEKLQILKLSNSEISHLFEDVTRTLTSLQVLDLDRNKIPTWFVPSFSRMPNLRYLSLRGNNINLISENMMYDFQNISFIGLSGNFMVCNCYSRELFELALRNERGQKTLFPKNITKTNTTFSFHSGFEDYNKVLSRRTIMTNACKPDGCKRVDIEVDGDFVLFDYDENVYQCLLESEGRPAEISHVKSCSKFQRDHFENIIVKSWTKLISVIVTVVVVAPLLVFGFVYRRNFRYFCITMRNSAMLSLINKNESLCDTAIFNYDVFVSYCNEDRAWVLDHLLPHVERDCNVSVCLHERDFQVGLSILENIVSCMDRSRSIMLIISQRFLLSQWCQFEMHLAQHRLLETRREDLILILIEDIPRRLRPNTLHYLMVTKTYIVWPKEESERTQFWRRLTKSLVTSKLKQNENVSLA